MKSEYDLDKMNNERIVTAKKRVAHALQIVRRSANAFESAEWRKRHSPDGRGVDDKAESEKVSAAVSLLESAAEDIEFACDHFGWDDSVRLQIDDAVIELGAFMSEIEYEDEENSGGDDLEYVLKDAEVKLSNALATLVHWFDDTVRVEAV